MKLPLTGALVALNIIASFLIPSVSAQPRCAPGSVWREAFSGDTVCVSVPRRQDVANENAAATSHRDPAGGPFGPDTCRAGYVWRSASPADHVCVLPQSRAQAAQDNAAAASHVATAGAAPAPAPAPAPVPSAYQTSPWSSWTRKDGAEFRSQWGWNPNAQNFPGYIDAIFEVRNLQTTTWHGSGRSLGCTSSTGGKDGPEIDLAPHESKRVTFTTINCGTRDKPFFRPSVVRSNTL